nr:tryptophan-rich sensory protein [Kibdelosporangium sp. MJ126-NF4]CEL16795.1 hypothetical protein [Kibdelosporangium sp. MJ126-NF4]
MTDKARAGALILVAVLQVAAGVVGGVGLWGESVGVVANSYPTLLLPGGAAFTIWSLIYVAFGALAVRQALPEQRNRDVHRRTGWWLVAAGVLNAAWVLLFTNRLILLAQLMIVALLACLLGAALRLQPADGWADRLLLHIPVMVYLGWVAVATVAGRGHDGSGVQRRARYRRRDRCAVADGCRRGSCRVAPARGDRLRRRCVLGAGLDRREHTDDRGSGGRVGGDLHSRGRRRRAHRAPGRPVHHRVGLTAYMPL